MTSTLADALFFVSTVLQKAKVPYALIGGIAFSYWVENRYTKDIDLTISVTEESWLKLSPLLKKNEKVKWILQQQPVEEKIPDLVRFTWDSQLIDLQMSKTDYQDALIQRRKRKIYLGKTIYFASPEDLFVTKILAYRPQDYADLTRLVAAMPKLDLSYIKKWCQFWEIKKRLDEFLLSHPFP